MQVVLVAVLLFGVVIVLIIDNFRRSGEFFQTDDILDTRQVHHEHIEVVLSVAALVLLMAAV